MKVLFAAAEIAPLTKVGGLADVVGSLPAELIKRGHDVRVIVPKYGFVDYSGHKAAPVIGELTVLSLQEYRKIAVERIMLDGVQVYLLSSDIFKHAGFVYGENEVEKFWVFCDAVCAALPLLGWQPDILHSHDWHTALLPLLVRRANLPCRTVLTIHNVRHQGNFDERELGKSGLGQYWYAAAGRSGQVPRNFLSQGILWAHALNTVSENFAREILTPEYGWGEQDLLYFRKNVLFGIRNGLGYEEYDPSADALIPAKYSAADLSGKPICKRELQKAVGWRQAPDIPLAGMVCRLDEQKGLDILIDAVQDILHNESIQFVVLGRGVEHYEHALKDLEGRFPRSIRCFIQYDNRTAHLIYAGSDMFMMPSRWEPGGIGQLIAMRYGTVPVVRRTGGLADTVVNFSRDLKTGSGFVFNDYSAAALVAVLDRAEATFKDKEAWGRAMKRIMGLDFTWWDPAAKYEALYRKALEMDLGQPL